MNLASSVVDGKMYVIGGRDMQAYNNLDPNEVYDPETDSWKSLEKMPTARSAQAISVLNNTIFVFGGEGDNHVYDNNEQYLPDEDRWITYSPMPAPVHGSAYATVGDRVFVIGGGVAPLHSRGDINQSYYNPNVIPEFDGQVLTLLGVSLIFTIIFLKTRFKNNILDSNRITSL